MVGHFRTLASVLDPADPGCRSRRCRHMFGKLRAFLARECQAKHNILTSFPSPFFLQDRTQSCTTATHVFLTPSLRRQRRLLRRSITRTFARAGPDSSVKSTRYHCRTTTHTEEEGQEQKEECLDIRSWWPVWAGGCGLLCKQQRDD